MAKIISQFVHIFIHYYSNKTASACKLFISEPTLNQERLLGRLFGILEINTPSRENVQIINQLISDLEEQYYGQAENENINFTESFENALKEVNQKFNQMIREGKILLVGNLNEQTIKEKINLGIGVLKDEEVYLSYLNNIGIYLIHKTKQDYKVIDIKKMAQDENNGGVASGDKSLFGNILMGQLNPSDYLFMANGNFLNYVTLERVQKIATSLPIHKAAEYFKNSLLQYEGNNFAAIIMKNSLAQDDSVKTPASLSSIAELNDTEAATEKLLAPSALNILKNLFDQTIALFKPTSKIRTLAKIKADKAAARAGAEVASEKITGSDDIIKAEKFPALKQSFAGLKKSNRKFFTKNIFLEAKLDKLKNYFTIKSNYFRYQFKKIPNLSKILLLTAGLLIILFIFSIFIYNHQTKVNADQQGYQNQVSQIQDLTNQASSDLIYGDEAKAKNEITDAQNLLANLPISSQKQKDTQNSLNTEILKVVAKIRHITPMNPELITDLSSQDANLNIQNLIWFNNSLLAFDSDHNENFAINSNKSVTKNLSNLTNSGKIVKAKIIDNNVIIYQDQNGFWQFKDGKYSPFTVALNPNSRLVDFAFYNNFLYTLDLGNNQIYRQPKTTDGFGSGQVWLKSAQDLKNANSLAIDSNLWILTNDGKLLKFTKGRAQAFDISGLDPALDSPTKLWTDDTTKYIYILEPKNKRIVVLDKKGKFVIQYNDDSLGNMHDFSVNEAAKKIYLVNDNKIYSFNLSHL